MLKVTLYRGDSTTQVEARVSGSPRLPRAGIAQLFSPPEPRLEAAA